MKKTVNPPKKRTDEAQDKPRKFIIYVGLGRLLKKPAAKSPSK